MCTLFSPHLIGIVLLVSVLLSVVRPLDAGDGYARQLDRSYAFSQPGPGGGGEPLPAGNVVDAAYQAHTEGAAADIFIKGFRLVVGYIHVLTAIFWFGTILYVHLILKPSYAANGLPHGELRVGIISMIVMGITGSILTYYRVTSFDTLFHTSFGVLLFIKVLLYLIMFLSALCVFAAIRPRSGASRDGQPMVESAGTFTREELAGYDGKDGRPAYFACEGKIYDAAQSPLWKQGLHMGLHIAGTDLTEALKRAPHGEEMVTAMTVVGELAMTAPHNKIPLLERVFFFLAYMNLTIVLLINLILSLWRWG